MSTQKERMYQQIEKHGENLNKIFHTKFDNITLCKKLRRLEAKAHKLAEDYCNGVIDFEAQDIGEADIAKKVAKILGDKVCKDGIATYPLVMNRDPRGYALKIDDEWLRSTNYQIERDWGGYGILAPEFNGKA